MFGELAGNRMNTHGNPYREQAESYRLPRRSGKEEGFGITPISPVVSLEGF